MFSVEIKELIIPEECKREAALWAAVFVQGIRDYKSNSPEFHPSAKRWFWSDEYHTGSFLWLCELFCITPEFARERIKNAQAV